MQETSSSHFIQLLYSLMLGHYDLQHVGVSGFYNITVSLIQLCAFVGLDCSS